MESTIKSNGQRLRPVSPGSPERRPLCPRRCGGAADVAPHGEHLPRADDERQHTAWNADRPQTPPPAVGEAAGNGPQARRSRGRRKQCQPDHALMIMLSAPEGRTAWQITEEVDHAWDSTFISQRNKSSGPMTLTWRIFYGIGAKPLSAPGGTCG